MSQAHTYVEVSPSGEGLHLIFKGSKPEGATRSRRGPAEMYDHDRFFTVTVNVFEGHSVLGANPKVIEKAYRLWIEPEYEQASRQATLAQASALVRVGVPGRGTQERPMAREALLNHAKVIGALAPMGANASSANCRDLKTGGVRAGGGAGTCVGRGRDTGGDLP